MVALGAVRREAVLRFRVQAQELDATTTRRHDAAVLDLGVQDTGPDGAGWALAVRGARPPADDLVLAWSLRGAPHHYRRLGRLIDFCTADLCVRPRA